MSAVDIVNEHDYDDEAFTAASLNCIEEVSEVVNDLWRSGASVETVAEELTNALHNSDVSEALTLVVKIERTPT